MECRIGTSGPGWQSIAATRHLAAAKRSLPCRAQASPSVSAPTAKPGTLAASEPVKLTFSVPFKCKFGQHIAIVGGPRQLGSWNATNGVRMEWGEGDVWHSIVEIDPSLAGSGFEYKYVVRNDDGSIVSWSPGSNISCKVPQVVSGCGEVAVGDLWHRNGVKQSVKVVEKPKPALARGQDWLRGFCLGFLSTLSFQGNLQHTTMRLLHQLVGLLTFRSVLKDHGRRLQLLRKSERKGAVGNLKARHIAGAVFDSHRRAASRLRAAIAEPSQNKPTADASLSSAVVTVSATVQRPALDVSVAAAVVASSVLGKPSSTSASRQVSKSCAVSVTRTRNLDAPFPGLKMGRLLSIATAGVSKKKRFPSLSGRTKARRSRYNYRWSLPAGRDLKALLSAAHRHLQGALLVLQALPLWLVQILARRLVRYH